MKKVIYYISICLICSSCLKELEFDDNSYATVISGVLSNSEGERQVTVTLSDGISTDPQYVESNGWIYKNGILTTELIQREPGILTLPDSFNIEAGATYYIEIQTKNNQVYQSLPQTVPEGRKTDSISFEIVQAKEEIDANGELKRTHKIDFYAYIDLPQENDTVYYKWQIDQAWNFVSERNTCYKTRNVREHPIALLSSEGYPQERFKFRVSSLDFDVSFHYKHYFNVYLHTIDKTSFEFYQKVDRLTKNIGNLYDQIPAPFKGNVFLSEGKEEIVLGNIEFSLADTLRFPIDSFMINAQFSVFRTCEDSKGINLPDYCADCLFEGLAEYYEEKPDYFVD